jgi:LPS sulfotransferase NodH
VQTRAWRAGEVSENGDAVYHAGAIGYLASQLTDHDAWRTWFSANRIEPLTIVYEELAADTSAATAAVIDLLGVGPAEIPEPPLRRQGDDRSARWVERYRA